MMYGVHFIKYSVFISSLVLISTHVQAEIYQCTNQYGETIFQEKKCQGEEIQENKTDRNKNIVKNRAKQKVIQINNTTRKNIMALMVDDDSNLLGKNILKNASFENKLIDWKVPLGARWSKNEGVRSSGVLIIQSKIPPKDKYIHETTVSQCVVLGSGEKYQLKGRFKAEKILSGKYVTTVNPANRVNVIWYESSDCTRGGQYGGYIGPKNISGWQDLIRENMRPAFKAKAAKITIVQRGRYARGYKGYWDNIVFAATEIFQESSKEDITPDSKYTLALNENYIKNSGFTKDISSWRGGRAEWTAYGNQSTGSSRVNFESKTGSFGAGAMSQCVNIGENVQFNFGASVKKDETSTQTGGGRIRVSWNEKENCSGRSKTDGNYADFKGRSGWQNLEVANLIAPSGSQSVLVELIQTISGKGRFSVYWDDIYLKAVR